MNGFFDVYPDSGSWSLYDATHLAWLAVMVIIGALLVVFYRRAGDKTRRRMELIVPLCTLGFNLFRAAVLAAQGEYDRYTLPLHLCAMSVYIELLYAIFPCKVLGELLYAVCMPGALAAMLLPEWTDAPLFNFMHITCFAMHILLVVYPIMLTAGGKHRPSVRRLPLCLLVLAALSVPIWFLNRHWNTNYMFLRHPGGILPLEWFEERLGDPGYLVGFPLLAAMLWLVLYAPIVIADIARKKKQTKQ
ncbi:MAG: TIGR02206 family membrane protein [Ruminococcaceae bacterium]|nr:TIGR02206 family membrane protein [Oscillospiraceae bacterium]